VFVNMRRQCAAHARRPEALACGATPFKALAWSGMAWKNSPLRLAMCSRWSVFMVGGLGQPLARCLDRNKTGKLLISLESASWEA
jgi:hypothetical protein